MTARPACSISTAPGIPSALLQDLAESAQRSQAARAVHRPANRRSELSPPAISLCQPDRLPAPFRYAPSPLPALSTLLPKFFNTPTREKSWDFLFNGVLSWAEGGTLCNPSITKSHPLLRPEIWRKRGVGVGSHLTATWGTAVVSLLYAVTT